jgi:hypothetical protein
VPVISLTLNPISSQLSSGVKSALNKLLHTDTYCYARFCVSLRKTL